MDFSACDWNLLLVSIGTIIAIVGLVYGIIRNFKNDIVTRIDRLDTDVRAAHARIDNAIAAMNASTAAMNARTDAMATAMNARTDKLYEMFMEQLKGQK